MIKKLHLKTMLLLCAMIMGIGSAWADNASFAPSNFTNQGTSGTGSAISATVSEVTFACDKGYGTTQIRCYSGGKITISSSNTITAISFTFSGSYTGGLNTSYSNLSTTSWEATLSSQARITAVTVTYTSAGDQSVATSVTIDPNGITNTDVYTATSAGSLSATVKDNNNTIISGASVTWSSSDENVATINANGVVTLVAAGTTTITATYAGVENQYLPSSTTYELTVRSSAPYVQPTTIEIVPNYEFWGKTAQFSGSEYSELSGEQDNVTLEWSRGSGSTYANQNAMRFYKDNTMTFTAPNGYEIKRIVLVGELQNDLTFSPEGFDLESKTWAGSSETVTMSRPSNASSYATISKYTITIGTPSTLVTPTVTINNAGITNTDVYTGTEAGNLSAAITYNDAAVEGATVTWSGNNDEVATINASTGAVTLVAAGSVTFTATFAGNEDYNEATATYQMTVSNSDPNAPGTENYPYTVAQAIDYINTLGSSTSANDVYVSGIISQVDSYNDTYKSITYWISDDGTTTGQMEVYSGKGLDGADFSAVTDLVIGDIVTVKGKVKLYRTTPEFDKDNQLVSITHSTVTSITVNPTTVSLAANDTEGEFAYTINNPIEGTTLTAASVAEWISNITVGTDKVTFNTTANEGAERTATITLTYGSLTQNVTVTQAKYVADYATLPFSWDGGTKTEFLALNGVTASGLGSDYATGNAPYLIKFDNTDDYIQVKTDGQIYNVTLEVKMIGGESTSTIAVKGSTNGEDFTDVEELQISGAQNDVLSLETTNAFNADYRYVRLVFTKGSNVGVGPITINCVRKAITSAGYATYCSPYALDFSGVLGLTAYTASLSGSEESEVSFSSVANVAANTGVLLKGAEGTYAIPVASSSINNTSALVGVNVATEKEAGIFVLMNTTEYGVGFYKAENAFTVGAHTAYIPALPNSSRDFIAVDETTAIKAVESQQQDGEIYNLAGQRVAKAQKGLYIIGGKKVVIK